MFKRVKDLVDGANALAKAFVLIPPVVVAVRVALASDHDRVVILVHEATRWTLWVLGAYWLVLLLSHALRDPVTAVARTVVVTAAGALVAVTVLDLVPDASLRTWVGADSGPELALAGIGTLCIAVAVVATWQARDNRRRPCPWCREPVRPGALRCPACRTYLPAADTHDQTAGCPQCAEMIRSEAMVCFHCQHSDPKGRPLGEVPRRGVQEHAPRPLALTGRRGAA